MDLELENFDLETQILGSFLLDETKLIAITILNPYHFINKQNQNIFLFLKNFYNENNTLKMSFIISKITDNFKKQLLIKIYTNADQFDCIESNFRQNEQKLIERWKREEIKNLALAFYESKINYSELSNRISEISRNEKTKSLLEISNDITNLKQVEREYTKINQLDWLLKGLSYGYIYLWTGITNAGKTTLMTQICNEMLRENKKIFYFSGEQTAEEFKNYLYVSMCNKEQVEYIADAKNKNIKDIVPKEQMVNYFDGIFKNQLFIYNNLITKNDSDTMISVMKEAVNRGIKIYFIDNFMQLDGSEFLEQQTKIIEQFKRFALENKVIINLVAHPRKTQFSSARLNIMDISGTQNIANKATGIITITRTDSLNDSDYDYCKLILGKCNYNIEKCDAFLEVLKSKGNGNGCVGLKYDKEFKKYVEAPKMDEKEYQQYLIESSKKKGRLR